MSGGVFLYHSYFWNGLLIGIWLATYWSDRGIPFTHTLTDWQPSRVRSIKNQPRMYKEKKTSCYGCHHVCYLLSETSEVIWLWQMNSEWTKVIRWLLKGIVCAGSLCVVCILCVILRKRNLERDGGRKSYWSSTETRETYIQDLSMNISFETVLDSFLCPECCLRLLMEILRSCQLGIRYVTWGEDIGMPQAFRAFMVWYIQILTMVDIHITQRHPWIGWNLSQPINVDFLNASGMREGAKQVTLVDQDFSPSWLYRCAENPEFEQSVYCPPVIRWSPALGHACWINTFGRAGSHLVGFPMDNNSKIPRGSNRQTHQAQETRAMCCSVSE